MLNKPTVLSSGEWSLPVALWAVRDAAVVATLKKLGLIWVNAAQADQLGFEELKNERKANVLSSKDNGQTFCLLGGADIPDRNFDEHMLIELGDGRLWMLIRTVYGAGHLRENPPGQVQHSRRAHLSAAHAVSGGSAPAPAVPMLEPDRVWTADGLQAHGQNEKVEVPCLEDLVEADARRLERLKSEGAVGFKTKSILRADPSRGDARATFERVKDAGSCANATPLADYLFWQCLKAAAKLDVPIAIHAGLWGDFRALAPTWMIPWAMRCPETRFDLFHLGLPNVREAAVIGKNFANVSLNLCWCYVMSERMTLRTIDELLDLVPVNKIIAFGGDYRCVVQKVYGHLVMARETVARALGRRVEEGEFSEERAMEIARMWFHDNAARIYQV